MSTQSPTIHRPDGTTRPTRDSWTWLLRVSALVLAANAVITQLAGRFLGPSMVVFAALTTLCAVLVGRRPRTAAALLTAVCLLNLVLHGFVFAILGQGLRLGLMYALASVDLVATALALAAAVAVLGGRRGWSRKPFVLSVAGMLVVLLATVLTFSFYLTRPQAHAQPGEDVLTNDGSRVVPDRLVLDEGSEGEFIFRNDDPLYPRSFDVDELDLHVVVPPRTARRIDLPAGEYEFYDYVTYTDATSGSIVVE